MNRHAVRALRVGVAALALPLGACMNMSGLGGDSKYACAAPEGVACDSVSGTYANAVHHNLPSQQRRSGPTLTTAAASSSSGSPNAAGNASAPPRPALAATTLSDAALSTASASSTSPALRSQSRYLRLWIKPWEDIDGDLFDQAHVYVQVDNGRWQIDHVRQQIRERYAPLRPPISSAPAAQGNSGADPSATAADAAGSTSPIQRPTVTDPRQLFPSLATPPSGLSGRPQ